MNRKSIVQIFVLVLLVAVGAGVYLSQQEGGLDFVRDLIGLGPSEPPKVVPRPRPVRKAAAPAPKPKPARAKTATATTSPVAIPAHPASGMVRNTAFSVDSADISNGVLTLHQGTKPQTTELKVFLKTKAWYVPAERTFQMLPSTAATNDTPMVQIVWRGGGQQRPDQSDFANKYTLKLEFGRVQDGKLPGKIQLTLPDAGASHVAGTFNADVRGFYLIDGKPDLAIDSVDTLQYLALHEVLKNDPDMKLTDVAFRQGRYDATPDVGSPTGYIEIQYRVGDTATFERKFQFAKEQDQWRIIATLRPDQLDAAHPHTVPGPKDRPERLFPYLAAKKIEADVQKRQTGKPVVASRFATRYNAQKKMGVAEVGYKVGDGPVIQTAFLFRLDSKGWKLQRELKKNEHVNLATGKIETASR